jgi:hypothetical protein
VWESQASDFAVSLIFTQPRILPDQRVAPREQIAFGRRALLSLAALVAVSCSRRSYSVTDAAIALRPGWRALRWDELQSARRAFAVVSPVDGQGTSATPITFWSRERTVDATINARSLSHVVALIAATRAELVRIEDTYRCDGSRCERPHGLIRPADALSLGCRGYFDELAPRLGAPMLASAFSLLGVSSPAVPEDPEARARLAAHGDGWTLSLDDALSLARALRARPGPEPNLWNEALVPRFGEPGSLRGVVAMDENEAWFVGFSVGAIERLVVAHTAECEGRAGNVVLAAARAAFEGTTRTSAPSSSSGSAPIQRRVRR